MTFQVLLKLTNKCSGGNPCEACAQRSSPCAYDATSDQRRKIAYQKNVHELLLAQEKLERHQQLLGGIIATIKAGTQQDADELVYQIRTGMNLSQLAAHVRNAVRSSEEKQHEYDKIEYVIDGGSDLPSPGQILNDMETIMPSPIRSNHSNEMKTFID